VLRSLLKRTHYYIILLSVSTYIILIVGKTHTLPIYETVNVGGVIRRPSAMKLASEKVLGLSIGDEIIVVRLYAVVWFTIIAMLLVIIPTS